MDQRNTVSTQEPLPEIVSTQPILQVDKVPQSAQSNEKVADNVPVETQNREPEGDPDSDDSYNSEDDCWNEDDFKNARGKIQRPVVGPLPSNYHWYQQQATQPTASSSSGINHNPYSAYTANTAYVNNRFGLVKTQTPVKSRYKSAGGARK